MQQFTYPNFQKIAIIIKDNAPVNTKTNRAMATKELKDLLLLELGCKIHNGALCMTRARTGILELYISGQLQWALFLNRGQVKITYTKCFYETAVSFMEPWYGTLQLSKMKRQRQIMALILMPHSYVD